MATEAGRSPRGKTDAINFSPQPSFRAFGLFAPWGLLFFINTLPIEGVLENEGADGAKTTKNAGNRAVGGLYIPSSSAGLRLLPRPLFRGGFVSLVNISFNAGWYNIFEMVDFGK